MGEAGSMDARLHVARGPGRPSLPAGTEVTPTLAVPVPGLHEGWHSGFRSDLGGARSYARDEGAEGYAQEAGSSMHKCISI